MSVGRITQNMMSRQSLAGLQAGLGRLSQIQEQLSTGRIINRPSDDPSGTTSAMRLRTSLAQQRQYSRNADDGQGWLNQTDGTLASVGDQVRRAHDLALQGANSGAVGPQARIALATEIDQIREGLIATANTTYLGRPIFGGITAGSTAYDASGTYEGMPGEVRRTVGDGVTLRVDTAGSAVFGPDTDTVFQHLADLSTALRGGDDAGISDAIGKLGTDGDRVATAQADVGTRGARIEQTRQLADDAVLSLTSALSEIENTDLPKATVDLKLQEVAYQAALGATARVMQPSLLDFLR